MKLYARARVDESGRGLADSDTRRAAGMAAAQIASNVAALAFTILFARILGASGYGSLAVLVSAFIILMVPGSALQIAVARELSRALAREDPDAGTGVRQWLKRLAVAVVVVAVVAVPLREVIASIVNVEQTWAAAAVPVTAVLWAMLCVERGALQGFGCYRIVAISLVAEATGRLVFGLALVGVGLDVTGAFLANALTLIAVGAVLAVPLGRRLPPRHDGMTREPAARPPDAGPRAGGRTQPAIRPSGGAHHRREASGVETTRRALTRSPRWRPSPSSG